MKEPPDNAPAEKERMVLIETLRVEAYNSDNMAEYTRLMFRVYALEGVRND